VSDEKGAESEAWRARIREMRQRMQQVREHAFRNAAAPRENPDDSNGFVSARQKSRRRE
jgi:hypothetical protein